MTEIRDPPGDRAAPRRSRSPNRSLGPEDVDAPAGESGRERRRLEPDGAPLAGEGREQDGSSRARVEPRAQGAQGVLDDLEEEMLMLDVETAGRPRPADRGRERHQPFVQERAHAHARRGPGQGARDPFAVELARPVEDSGRPRRRVVGLVQRGPRRSRRRSCGSGTTSPAWWPRPIACAISRSRATCSSVKRRWPDGSRTGRGKPNRRSQARRVCGPIPVRRATAAIGHSGGCPAAAATRAFICRAPGPRGRTGAQRRHAGPRVPLECARFRRPVIGRKRWEACARRRWAPRRARELRSSRSPQRGPPPFSFPPRRVVRVRSRKGTAWVPHPCSSSAGSWRPR